MIQTSTDPNFSLTIRMEKKVGILECNIIIIGGGGGGMGASFYCSLEIYRMMRTKAFLCTTF